MLSPHDTRRYDLDAWREAFAAEVLAALTGRDWIVSRAGAPSGPEHCPRLHPWHFRRKGARGPATWSDFAMTIEPYFGEAGELPPEVMRTIEHYIPVGCAVLRADRWSCWFPDYTTLVLVTGASLDATKVRRFGFKLIGPAA